MWKVQHPDGQREINELHVPARPAGAADHDLAGRDPQLLRPGASASSRTWCPAATRRCGSAPTSPASYHLFCAEYCGTDHAQHERRRRRHGAGATTPLAARSRAASRRWPQQGAAAVPPATAAAAATSRGGTVRAPPLDGLFGSPVQLPDGTRRRSPTSATSAIRSCCRSAGRRRLRSRHAVVRRAGQRGRAARARRLHQVARAAKRRGRR